MIITGALEIWTDGACVPNPGFGGRGAVVLNNKSGKTFDLFDGPFAKSTNNRMEMMAVIGPLEFLLQRTGAISAVIYTDSKYVQLGITEWIPKWKKRKWITSSGKPVVNKDLWQRMDNIRTKHRNIAFKWVKGHAGVKHNERADQLASKGRTQ